MRHFILSLLFFGSILNSQAANRYWISSTSGNWNASANWSASSGGVGGASVPGASDVAIFDGAAGANGQCNVVAGINVGGIQITSGFSGNLDHGNNTITIGANGFSMAGGIFIGGNGNFDDNGNFTLSGGTFISPKGSFTVGGTRGASATIFTHSGGTFVHNGATLTFDAVSSCSSLTFTADVLTSTQFFNITINTTATCGGISSFATAAGDTLDVQNDLTHTDGRITGLLSVQNNLTINGTTDGGSGQILFEGTGVQTYSVTAANQRTCFIVINKNSGNVEPAVGTTTLSAQGFTQTKGDFLAPSGSFFIGGNFSANTTLYTHTAGTFSHNSGTIVFEPFSNCFWGTYTVDVLNATRFFNVQINAQGSCSVTSVLTTAANDTIDADNDITITDGSISGTFELQNNLIVNTNSDGGTGWIVFNGTGAQTYSVAASAPRIPQVKILKTAGAVSPAVGTTDFSVQGFHQITGDFTAPSGTFKIGGTWGSNQTILTHAGGTFSHNNGTVQFDPYSNCFWGTFTLDVINSTNFYNVHINAQGSCSVTTVIATAANDTIDADNDLTITDGSISGKFELQNNLIVNSNSDGGTGYIIFNGTGVQTYSVAAAAPRIPQVVVTKTAGSVAAAIGTTDLSVQGFHLYSGDFTAPTGVFKIGGTWSSNQTIFTHTGGTFNNNNGTTHFDPYSNCYWGTFTLDVLNATRFYNVIVNAQGSCSVTTVLTTAANDTIDADNDLTITDGSISGKFELQNNLIVNANSDGGSGYIIFNGTGAQTYSVAASAPRIPQVVVNKSSGDVTPAVGTTDFSVQGFHEILGDFTAPTGMFKIGGTWGSNQTILTHAAGTFTHNNGTVQFDPYSNCYWGTFTLDVINATHFNNVIINAQGSCGVTTVLATAANDTIDADNDLTITDGSISGKFELQNNLIVNSNSDGGSGYIIFNGTSAQTYSVAASAPRIPQVVVNKSSGDVTPAVGTTDFSVQGFHEILGDFTAPTGMFKIGGTWGSNQTILTHAAGTFTHNNGTVQFDPYSNCYWGTFTLDVINATHFNNVIINAQGSCGVTTVLATAANDTIDADNDLTITDGSISGKFELQNNLIVNANSDGGSGWIIFNGTAGQTYSVAASAPRIPQVKVLKSSGAVTPAVGTTDFSVQGFHQITGDFTAPTGNFRIGGTWGSNQTLLTHSGGVFTHNNATTIFDPYSNCYWGTYTIDIIPSTQFYHFTFDASGSCGVTANVTITAGDTIDVTGNLIYTNGVINTGFVEAAGNVTVQSTFDGGNGGLIFGSGNAQNFDLTGATALFNGDIKMRKTANDVTLLSACQLDAASQDLFFVQGRIFSTSSNLMILGDNVATSGASDLGYVDGPVRKIGNDAFTFPIGKNNFYRPASISAPSNTAHHFTAEYFQVDPNTSYDVTLKDATLDHISRCEYWIIDRTNGASNVNVRLSWHPSTSCGVTVLADLAVSRWDGAMWKDHGNGGTTGNTTSGTVITSAAVTAFSPFTLASRTLANPLPIELIAFNANCKGDEVQLLWSTASEQDNAFFTIERSENGNDFVPVAQVSGAGNSNTLLHYTYNDTPNQNTTLYYRLKQTDHNGNFSYSDVVYVACTESDSDFSIYPNPNSGNEIYIKTGNIQEASALVTIINELGQVVMTKTVNQSGTISVDFSTTLAPGIYTIQLVDGNQVYSEKMVVR